MPSTTYQVGLTRPRQSLTCVVCRRRKVRCGREQPACSNCVRIREACEYESDSIDGASRQGKRKTTSVSSRGEAAPNLSVTQEPLSIWAAQQRRSPPGHTSNIDRRTELDEPSTQRTTNHSSVSTSPFVDRQPDSSISSSSKRPFSQDLTNFSNPFFPSSRPQNLNLASKSIPSWETSSQEDLGHPLQLTTPSLNTSTAWDSEIFTPPRRHRTVENDTSLNEQERMSESPTPKQKRLKASADFVTLDGGEPNPRPVGYLSLQQGGQIRYVSDSFWGLIKGHESLCETFLGVKYDIPYNVPLPYINSFGLAELLTTLPNKVVCDALLQSFSISINPIHPLIHLPTFRSDYNNFWQWCRNSDISQPDNKLLGDPTFLCLLFSVLYCGATVCPPVIWMADNRLKDLAKESTMEQLRETYSTSLSMCQHLQHPTLSTLVSSLLAHSCSRPDETYFEDLRLVGMNSRIAQSMGLHRDGSSFGLDTITSELRRRVWWHIVWLDVETSMLHGSQPCCGSYEAENNVKMVSEIRDEDNFMITNSLVPRDLPPSPSATSIPMLLAIGRFETTRFKQFLVNSLHSARDLGQTLFDKLVSAAKSLQMKLDKLMTRIPTQGIPETGFIPSRFANATPLTHEWLYSDRASQMTIWNSWAKNILTMLKTEVAILVQKPFLLRPDSKSKQQQRMWNSVFQLCITHLRNFMQLMRIPAFAPYSWFCISSQLPLQPVFLILTYLQDNKGCASRNIGRYFVDEVIDVFDSLNDRLCTHREDSHDPAAPSTASTNKQVPMAWKMLAELRSKLDQLPNEERSQSKPVAPTRCQLVPPDIALRTISISNNEKRTSSPTVPAAIHSQIDTLAANRPISPPFDVPGVNRQYDDGGGDPEGDNLLDTADLEAWCSNLTQDPDVYLPGSQNSAGNAHGAPGSALNFDGEMLDVFGS